MEIYTLGTVQLFKVPEKTRQEYPPFLEITSCFLEYSHLKHNETVKSSIVTLHMTFERFLKDFKGSYLAKTQVLPIAFAAMANYEEDNENNSTFPISLWDLNFTTN